MHVRYRAWLDARPGKSKTSRLSQLKRREDKGEDVPELELPEIPEAVDHVVDYLFEIGPVVGDHPVPFTEITAWRSETGAVINEFEATAIRSLSQSYLGQLIEAADAKCPAPLIRKESLPSKEEVSNALRDLFRSFNTAKSKQATMARKRERKAKAAAQKETDE